VTLVHLHSCFSFPRITVAHCDAGTVAGWNETPELITDLNDKIRDSILRARSEYSQYPTKEYPSELKPLLSAFGLKNFTITTLRSFLLYYLPLLQPKPHPDTDDEDEDLLEEAPREPVDLVTPFYNSVKQIMREASSFTFRINSWTFYEVTPTLCAYKSLTNRLLNINNSKHCYMLNSAKIL
jgi:hypothetical protein